MTEFRRVLFRSMIYSSHGNFMQDFRLGRSAREHFLKMLGCVLNDIEHNFIDTVSAGRILQWRAAVQELISVGFAVEFILEHLREIARAFFVRRVRPVVEAIDVRIELLKKEVADLEGRHERLLSGIGGPSRFGIRVSFLDFTDDSTVSFPFLCFSIFVMSYRTLLCFQP